MTPLYEWLLDLIDDSPEGAVSLAFWIFLGLYVFVRWLIDAT